MSYYQSCHPDNCKECSLGKQEGVKVIHSILPSHAKVLFIGDAPSADENHFGTLLAGHANALLLQVMEEVGINRSDVAFSNVVACFPLTDRAPSNAEIKKCSAFLSKEIEIVNPDLIVTLGGVALKVLYPELGVVSKVRGLFYDLPDLNCKILPMYHPGYILKSPMERSKFVSDLNKVSLFMKGENVTNEKKAVQYFTVTNKAQLDWAVEQLHNQELWACDTETTSVNPLEAKIFIATFSWKENTAVLLDSRYFEDDPNYFFGKLREILENNSKKIFQNGGYDIQCFMNHDILVNNYYADTMLMHYLLDENSNHGLGTLAYEYTDLGGYDVMLDRYRKDNKIDNYMDIPLEVIHPYAQTDADVTLRAYNKMLPLIEKEGLHELLFSIIIPMQKILAFTEFNGVSIDVPYLDKITIKYAQKMAEQLELVKNVPQVRQYVTDMVYAEKDKIKVHWAKSKTLTKKFPTFEDYLADKLSKKPDLFNIEFNVNSPKQLKELLVDRMRLKVFKRSKKGAPSTDKEVLEEYAKTNSFCASLLTYRTLSHLKSTFLDGITKRLTAANRVHTDYYLWSTGTGRLSSRDPNLANIPRTGTADDIKDIFCSDPNTDNWLMEADAGQAEFRMWINYSKDPQALHDLNQGIDIHKLMGAAGKGKTLPKGDISDEDYQALIADVIKAERQAAKNVVFGLMYGRGAASVAKQLGISKAQAETIINVFFERYQSAYQWLKITIATTRVNGYVKNLYGRKRRLPAIKLDNSELRSEAERQSINAPIQSGASDTVFLAAIRIFKHLWSKGMKTRLVLTVYDSLVFNIPDNELQEVIQLVSYEMIKPPDSRVIVPLTTEVKVGTHWGSLMEINPTEDWDTTYNKLVEHRKVKDDKFTK